MSLNKIPTKGQGVGGGGGNWKVLYNAAETGDFALAERMLKENDCDPNFQHAEVGCTPLVEATRNGYVEIVKILLENGADPDVRADFWDDGSPLYIAEQRGHTEIADLLRKHGGTSIPGTASEIRPNDKISCCMQ